MRPTHGWGNTVLAVAAVLLVLVFATSGLLVHAVTGVVVATLAIALVSRIIGAVQRDLELGLLRRFFAPELFWARAQLAVRVLFLAGWVLAASSTIRLLSFFEDGAVRTAWIAVASLAVLAVVPWLVPRRRIRVGTNVAFAAGAVALFALAVQAALPDAGATVDLRPPMRVETAVFQGGDAVLLNHHYLFRSQRHALDLIALEDGRAVRVDDPKRLEDYVCFDQPLVAPSAGTVVRAVGDRPDAKIGETDLKQIIGNHVVLDIGEGRFLLLAHMKQGSLGVAVGDRVACGQILGRCGNSGNTSMPHLHIQVQSAPDFDAPDLRTFRMRFTTDGAPPRRGDRLAPASDTCP